ncbi:hypothetical protein JTE90_013833 [Oedothorax gibbosus]|uniref:Uncharacterized protein n=1 Tax=Oedothorax gibbosus TaxID=931172 RepID=A0AAV6VHU0_9ARAC|nr:hypothetical protein JTE90_013833 [Oedothorax gibbosus]
MEHPSTHSAQAIPRNIAPPPLHHPLPPLLPQSVVGTNRQASNTLSIFEIERLDKFYCVCYRLQLCSELSEGTVSLACSGLYYLWGFCMCGEEEVLL